MITGVRISIGMVSMENTREKNEGADRSEATPSLTCEDEGAANELTLRLLTWQQLSMTFESQGPFDISIGSKKCRVAFRTAGATESAQRVRGGTFVVIEFPAPVGSDLMVATQKGMDLVEDVMSALALVEGVTLGQTEPIQLAGPDAQTQGQYVFAQFLPLSYNHWDRRITTSSMDHIRALVAHWDGLDIGSRLRRAARQFRQAIGMSDNLTAFQYAYMGLEAMEKPLAQALGIPAGVEDVSGKCAACGETYTRRRTVLAGVRAYIRGDAHPETASEERRAEWKELSGLRQDLFHGLKDAAALEDRTPQALAATMHYLHDAISCYSHAHDLESGEFGLARKGARPVIMGQFTANGLGPIEEWRPLLGIEEPA